MMKRYLSGEGRCSFSRHGSAIMYSIEILKCRLCLAVGVVRGRGMRPVLVSRVVADPRGRKRCGHLIFRGNGDRGTAVRVEFERPTLERWFWEGLTATAAFRGASLDMLWG